MTENREEKDNNALNIQEIHKEIDLIQGCIVRMANNSFFIKGWLVALLAVVIALFSETIDIKILAGLILGIAIVFWYLDAFFLKMETLYRWKYEWVIQVRANNNREHFYDLNPYNKGMWLDGKAEKNIIQYMFSKTLVPLYGFPCLLSIIILLIQVTQLLVDNTGINVYILNLIK